MVTEPAIATSLLTRDFPAVRAVDGLTLEVAMCSVFGFLGPNGSGKTTTIRLLLGLLSPSEGTARVLGFDVRREAGRIRERCGALLEHDGLYERMTAEDNLEFAGRAWRMPAAERRARTRQLLDGLGLWERRHEAVVKWSRGMKQKLGVARALYHRPALVFLDEPTAGLDPIAAAGLRDDLVNLARREGVTVFLTTHNLAEAERVCDRVGVIRRGRLIDVGRPADLRARAGGSRMVVTGQGFDQAIGQRLLGQPAVASVETEPGRLTIGLRDGLDTSGIVAFLVHQGVAIDEVHKGVADLEEAFLSLMEREEVADPASDAPAGPAGGGGR